ncbi:MAG TPA: pantetheine-phosphate adenylyltransferase [Spirochaetes bacterium]|nr:pantetheine-phosphate adenylyltransferase [Spirochaetota bacterium]
MYHFKSAVAGTFDVLHKGHRVLIEEAFKQGEFVLVGITKDGFKESKPIKVRKRNLDKLLRARYPERYEIVEIEDELGPAVVDPALDALIVSEETYSKAAVINKLRKEKGLKKLIIYKISMVLAADGKPISSLRINNGEIDKEGNLLN